MVFFKKNILFVCFFALLLSSCGRKKYTVNDGEPVLSNSFELIPDNRLLSVDVLPLPIVKDACWEVTDFDYQNAGISMESYSKINVDQYKKYFSRKGDLDFYIHPIICNGNVYDIKKDATIVAYELKDEKVKKLWSARTLTSFSELKNILLSQARLEGKYIYITTSNGYILSFDLEQKKVIWKTQFLTIFSASPTIYGNVLYVVSGDDELYAIDKNNGKMIWKTTNYRNANDKKQVFQISPVTIYDDKIVIGMSDGWIEVYSLDGNLIWKNKVISPHGENEDISDVCFPPLVHHNVVVAGGLKTSVMGFDFKTGQPLWQIPTGLNSFMLLNEQGFGFFVNDKNENVCFVVENGAIRWLKHHNKKACFKISGYLNNGNTSYYQTINRYFDAY